MVATCEYPEEMCNFYGLEFVSEVEQVTGDKPFSNKLTPYGKFSMFSTSIQHLFDTNTGLETEEIIIYEVLMIVEKYINLFSEESKNYLL